MAYNVCGYEKLRPTGAIWVEALQEPNLISAVIRPECSEAKRECNVVGAKRRSSKNIFCSLFIR